MGKGDLILYKDNEYIVANIKNNEPSKDEYRNVTITLICNKKENILDLHVVSQDWPFIILESVYYNISSEEYK